MADTKISGLASASALDGTETTVLVQGGVTKKSLLSALLTYMGITLAPKASPTFTGVPAAPTAAAATNTTQLATTAFVTSAVAANRDRVRVSNSAAQTIPDNAFAVLTFNTEQFDSNGMHSTGTNPSRLTFQTTGDYLTGANVSFAVNAGGRRVARLMLNGTTEIMRAETNPNVVNAEAAMTLSTIYRFTATDYIELEVYQNTGGNLDTFVIGVAAPQLWAVQVA